MYTNEYLNMYENNTTQSSVIMVLLVIAAVVVVCAVVVCVWQRYGWSLAGFVSKATKLHRLVLRGTTPDHTSSNVSNSASSSGSGNSSSGSSGSTGSDVVLSKRSNVALGVEYGDFAQVNSSFGAVIRGNRFRQTIGRAVRVQTVVPQHINWFLIAVLDD